jgi:glyceraldehyde-3-phosphate dehydrogenase (NADP+)
LTYMETEAKWQPMISKKTLIRTLQQHRIFRLERHFLAVTFALAASLLWPQHTVSAVSEQCQTPANNKILSNWWWFDENTVKQQAKYFETNEETLPYVTAPSSFILPDEDDVRVQNVDSIGGIPFSTEQQSCNSDTDNDSMRSTLELKTRPIGQIPIMREKQALQILDLARSAYDRGTGVWTSQLSMSQRIQVVEQFALNLENVRQKIVQSLIWEIGKAKLEAENELDRTLQFIHQVISELRKDATAATWSSISSVTAAIRRGAIGIVLALGPYNYPLNETYATIIPALLMGNIVILKLPTVGGLVHLHTIQAFYDAIHSVVGDKITSPRQYPIHFITGAGRSTMPPLMKSGHVNVLSFIGSSSAANNLINAHPSPSALKVFLQLEAKNPAIYLPGLFAADDTESSLKISPLLENALAETIAGTLSYNGQRCTALKILFVPSQCAADFVDLLVQRVEGLRIGLPNQRFVDKDNNTLYAQITPLPNKQRIQYMKELIADAVSKGASILNAGGGQVVGDSGGMSTLMIPAVLYPVDHSMKIYHAEQFGPVIPIVKYGSIDEVVQFARNSTYGQQASIFGGNTKEDVATLTTLVDAFANLFGRINLNTQCARSPDTVPFSGRKSSAMGVMSVSEVLREFSIPTVISFRPDVKQPMMVNIQDQVVSGLSRDSVFLAPIA